MPSFTIHITLTSIDLCNHQTMHCIYLLQMDQRSLASEFEKLCSTTTNSKSNETSQNDESFESANPDASKTAAENKTSPNNVLDFDPDEDAVLPNIQIDCTLHGDLAQGTLDRVAVYHVIQSVNM